MRQELEIGGEIQKYYRWYGGNTLWILEVKDSVPWSHGSMSRWLDPQGNVLSEDRSLNGEMITHWALNYYDSMQRRIAEVAVGGYNLFNDANLSTGEYEDIYNEPRPGVFKSYTYSATGAKTSERIFAVNYYSACDEKNNKEPQPQKDTFYYYDILDRMVQKVEDPNTVNRIVDYGYDAAGNRIYVVDPNGNVIFTDYDNAGRKIREYFACVPEYSGEDIDFATTKTYAKISKEYDYYRNGKIKDVTSYDNDGTTPLEYYEYAYDLRGRIQTVTQQVDDSNDAVTQYDYNDVGFSIPDDSNLYDIKITDANDEQTYICLNEDRKFKKVMYPSGYSEELLYDANGICVGKIVWRDGNPYTLQYEYDDFGRPTKVIYPQSEGDMEFEYVPYLWEMLDKSRKVMYITDNRVNQPYSAGATYEMQWHMLTGNLLYYWDSTSEYLTKYKYNAAYPDSKKRIQVYDNNDPPDLIYDVNYTYDLAGELESVLDELSDSNIASLQYDDNGNCSQLKYWLKGTVSDVNTTIDYTYDIDNRLTGIIADVNVGSGDPNTISYIFEANDTNAIDGLGRLVYADETIAVPNGPSPVKRQWEHDYGYDMLSQLTSAVMDRSDTGPTDWSFGYHYLNDGNIWRKTLNAANTDYQYDKTPGGSIYDCDIMTSAGGSSLTWDKNGRLVTGLSGLKFYYDWDGMLSDVDDSGDNAIASFEYDPLGNRVYKWSSDSNTPANGVTYIVDVSGQLPTILCEMNYSSGVITSRYYYTNGRVLKQDNSSGSFYYVHDRLGSVRLVTDANGAVRNSYTYNPFGEAISAEDCNENILNPFKFTGQWLDYEFGWYYLRARMYAPVLGRFASRDPIWGKFEEPLSLHRYLYCENEPTGRADPMGLWYKWIHQSFGRYGSGNYGSLFDYARLDFDKPATDIWHLKEWRPLHFQSKEVAAQDILMAIRTGDITGFEYAMHSFQDTYTHYDRGWTEGHLPWIGVDDLDWSNPDDVAAYRDCDEMTRFFENMFIKSNIGLWMEHPEVDLPSSNPWLSIFDSWSSSSTSGIGGGYLGPIYRQQVGDW